MSALVLILIVDGLSAATTADGRSFPELGLAGNDTDEIPSWVAEVSRNLSDGTYHELMRHVRCGCVCVWCTVCTVW